MSRTNYAEDRTGSPASVVANWRNTRAQGKAHGSRTSSRRVDCETMAATFKSCSRSVLNCARPSCGANATPWVRKAGKRT